MPGPKGHAVQVAMATAPLARLSFVTVMAGVLWAAGFVARTRNHPLEPLLYYGMWAALALALATVGLELVRSGRVHAWLLYVLTGFISLIAFQFFAGMVHVDIGAVERGVQLMFAAGALALGWLSGAGSAGQRERDFLFLYITLLVGSTAFFAFVLVAGSENWFNPNVVGYLPMYLLALGYVAVKSRTGQWVVTLSGVLPFAIALAYQARAGIIAGLGLVMVVHLARVIRRSAFSFGAPLAATAAGIVVMLAVATHTSLVGLRMALEAWSWSTLGRRFFTGRDELWATGMDAIAQRPVLGWGPSAEVGDFMATGLSMHNYYLQIMLEGGVIGLILIAILLGSIAVYFYSRRRAHAAMVGYGLLIAVLIQETFGVSLTQTAFASGVPAWLLLGLCMGMADREVAGKGEEEELRNSNAPCRLEGGS